MNISMSLLQTAPLADKLVLVRADLNVPRSKDGKILSDFRLKAILPTLHLIKMRGGKIVLISHCGRPTEYSKRLSLESFSSWFKKNDLSTRFAQNPDAALSLSKDMKEDLLLVENLRFFPGEYKKDLALAQSLAKLGSYFVQDSFATLHRDQTSMTLLAEQYDSGHKTIGLLVEKELKLLNHLKTEPKQPFILFLGGSKIATKLPVIEHLLDKVNAVLIAPALSFTFLEAKSLAVGQSLVDKNCLETARQILIKAQEKGVKIILPVDYVVTNESFEKPFPNSVSKKLTDRQTGVSFGPETAALFKHCILQARTLFLNGVSGNPSYPETLEGMRKIFLALQQTYATKIIGGGHIVNVAEQLGFNQNLGTFLTGGGAALAYLSGDPLPGLLALR